MRRLHKLRAGFEGILYVAPERFAAPSFRALLPQLRPRLFVVDEAHCVSFWGHDFRPEYMRLAEIREALGSPVTIALTATATPQVRSDIASFLKLRSPKLHVTGFDRPNLRYAARFFRNDGEKDEALLNGLPLARGTGIIYCATRKTVEELTALLRTEFSRPHHLRLSRRHGAARSARASQERFMHSTGRGHRRHQCLRHGHQQARHPLCAALQPAGQRRSLLPGSGPGRTRWPYLRIAFCTTRPRDFGIQEFFIEKIGENNEQLKYAEIAQLQANASRKLEAMMQYAKSTTIAGAGTSSNTSGSQHDITNCGCDVCRGR